MRDIRCQPVPFKVDAGFVADLAIGVVKFEVAEDHAIVGASDKFGDG